MRRTRALIIGVALFEAAGLAAACSSFSADDPPSGNTDGGGEASSSDTFVPGVDAASDVDSGADPTLVFAEDFEQGVVESCGPRWVPQSATRTRVADGRDGGMACRICTQVSPGNFYGIRISGLPADAGQSYVARAWMKQASTPPSAPTAFANLDYTLLDGGTSTAGLPNSLTATWVLYELTASPQGPAPTLSFFAGANAALSAECFVLDDVTLHTQ
jgi:hypothetical protein